MQERMEFQISGKWAIVVGVIVIVGLVFRGFGSSESQDPELEKEVRAALWSTYSGTKLGPEINRIREEQDYDSVSDLLQRSDPEAITIEQISRSEPLLSWSSSQKVIVRVRYRFPEDTETQTEYMKFDHSLIAGWVYRYDSTGIAYYMNFF